LHNPQDEDQFLALIQEHQGIIHKLLGLYAFDGTDPKDLKQEMILQLWKSLPGFKAQSRLSTWIYKVCLNTALSYNRQELRHQSIELAEANRTLVNQAPTERHELLLELIRELEAVDRMTISLYLDGYKNKEIAEITGMSANLVNVRIHRIKQQLSESLKTKNHE